VALKADSLDLRNTGSAIGPEYEPEDPGNEVVELCAGLGIGKFGTLAARSDLFVDTTGAHLAPGSLCIFAASPAFFGQEGFAGTAIQTAIGNQFSISPDNRHIQISSWFDTHRVEGDGPPERRAWESQQTVQIVVTHDLTLIAKCSRRSKAYCCKS